MEERKEHLANRLTDLLDQFYELKLEQDNIYLGRHRTELKSQIEMYATEYFELTQSNFIYNKKKGDTKL